MYLFNVPVYMYLFNVPLYIYLFNVPLYIYLFEKTMIVFCYTCAISTLSDKGPCTVHTKLQRMQLSPIHTTIFFHNCNNFLTFLYMGSGLVVRKGLNNVWTTHDAVVGILTKILDRCKI